MSDKKDKRRSIVEDVPIPKHLLSTAKFDSPWEQVKWEKSLPQNDRLQRTLSTTLNRREKSGLSRSSSLSALKVSKPPRTTRPLTNPPALTGTLVKNRLSDISYILILSALKNGKKA